MICSLRKGGGQYDDPLLLEPLTVMARAGSPSFFPPSTLFVLPFSLSRSVAWPEFLTRSLPPSAHSGPPFPPPPDLCKFRSFIGSPLQWMVVPASAVDASENVAASSASIRYFILNLLRKRPVYLRVTRAAPFLSGLRSASARASLCDEQRQRGQFTQ